MKEFGPWKALSERKIYDSPWLTVHEDKVINPGGKEGTYSRIHFKNYAIGIVALDDHHNVWLVGQYRYPLRAYSWEIPEGGGDLNVTALESAKRELLEETGIKAKKWKKIQEVHLSNSATDEKGIIYLATDLSFHSPQPEENEKLEIKKVSFQTFFEDVMKGEITDSLSVISAYKIKILLDNKGI